LIIKHISSKASGRPLFGIFENTEAQGLPDRVITLALTAFLLVAAIVTVSGTLYWVFNDYRPVPIMDEWSIIHAWVNAETGSGSAWLAAHHQHNEHRILVPRLFFFTDLKFFGGFGLFTLVILLLAHTLHTVVLTRVVFQTLPFNIYWKTAVTGFLFTLMFSTVQLNNLIWPFQIQIIGVFLFGTVTFLLLLKPQSSSIRTNLIIRTRHFLLGLISAMLASFTMSNGLLVWPVGLLLGVHRKWSAKKLAVFFFSGCLVWWLYLKDYESGVPFSRLLDQLPEKAWSLIQYSAVLLGTPLSPEWPDLALVIGMFGILIMTSFGILFVIDRKHVYFTTTGSRLFICLAVFCLTTALVTGIGRLDLGIRQATTNRYGTAAVLFWIAAIGTLVTVDVRELKSRIRLDAVAVFLAIFSLIHVLTYQVKLDDYSRDWINRKQAGVTSILAGVVDLKYLTRLFPTPDRILRDSEFLREHRLSFYGSEIGQIVGQPLATFLGNGTTTNCEGYIDKISIISDGNTIGARIEGWAVDRATNEIPKMVVFANQGTVSGIGFSGRLRPDVEALYPGYLYAGWLGHATFLSGTELEAYISVGTENALCKLIDIHGD